MTETPPPAGTADRTTELAVDRTVYAAERTYAAWVRTGIAALASGIGARALLPGLMPELLLRLSATILVAFSTFCFAAAVWRELFAEAEWPTPDVKRIPSPVLFAMNGTLIVVSLAALVSVWLQS